jgi:Domain of unknown function (DUF4367)
VACTTCVNDTEMIRIGTGDYCSKCGSRADPQTISATTAKSTGHAHRSMDIGRVRRGAPQISPRLKHPVVASGVRPGKLVSDVSPHSPTPTATRHPSTAAALHARRTGRAVDLRKTTPPTSTASKVTIADGFEDRLNRAKQISRSTSVAKFSQHFQSTVGRDKPEQPALTSKASLKPVSSLPAAAATHHEALTKLIGQMPPVSVPNANSHVGRAAAVIGAIAIMGSYVWLQNYPKMAISAAGNKAGLSASMPGFVPSSYSLKKTITQPGLVTLQFATPNQTQSLTIDQHRTDWDSSSLLDNFVAKQDSEYASVSGQGLTVYLFKQNQAAWINHGVWYSITGATRLSREQILKIAYSL